VLTDNGRQFCGKPESHPYELTLAVEVIKHRTTKVRSPRTNGFVEQMPRGSPQNRPNNSSVFVSAIALSRKAAALCCSFGTRRGISLRSSLDSVFVLKY
jgi:hypothetical protein